MDTVAIQVCSVDMETVIIQATIQAILVAALAVIGVAGKSLSNADDASQHKRCPLPMTWRFERHARNLIIRTIWPHSSSVCTALQYINRIGPTQEPSSADTSTPGYYPRIPPAWIDCHSPSGPTSSSPCISSQRPFYATKGRAARRGSWPQTAEGSDGSPASMKVWWSTDIGT